MSDEGWLTIVLGVSKLPGQPTLLLHVGDLHGRQHSSLQLKDKNGRGGGGGGGGMFRPFAFAGTSGESNAWWVFGPVTKSCERVTVNGIDGEIFDRDDMNLNFFVGCSATGHPVEVRFHLRDGSTIVEGSDT